MEDVIFAGITARPGPEQAEVALMLEDGFPSPFASLSEVQVVRHIVRGSGSSYRVNGRMPGHGTCRRYCRERQMQRFKSARHAQQFLSAHGPIYGHFWPRRHRMEARGYRAARTIAFRVWREEKCARSPD